MQTAAERNEAAKRAGIRKPAEELDELRERISDWRSGPSRAPSPKPSRDTRKHSVRVTEIKDVRKLYITVTNDDGDVVYRTWNDDRDWSIVTLYLNERERPLTDARADVMGAVIGKSVWG